jgi:hypothetical protein
VSLPLPPKLQQVITKIAKLAVNSKLMTKQQCRFVTQKQTDETSQLPNLYLLPKLHKTPITGRPIVSSHSYITTPASKWLDWFLQPLVRTFINTVITDTRQFINRIESTRISIDSCLLTTADVTSLYPSIPTRDGIVAVESFLRDTCKIGNETHIRQISDLFRFVLNNNYFNANKRTYRQIKGTAMGTPCAVVFANIYMFVTFDSPLLQRMQPTISVMLYGRFIDDICLVTAGISDTELHRLMSNVNPKISLSIQSSPRRAEFLDLVIYKGPRFYQNEILDLAVHQKEFNRYLYIPWNSFHTTAMKLGFICTELRRYVRNSSSAQNFESLRAAFYLRLRARGYPKPFLLDAFDTIKYSDRPRFLCATEKQSDKPFPLLFKTTYTPLTSSFPIRSNLTTYWHCLDPITFPKPPIIGYKRTTNIAGLLCSPKS